MMKTLSIYLTACFICIFSYAFAQDNSMIKLPIGNTFTLDFPAQHSDEKFDLRELMEGKSNDIIYSIFISDEFNYTPINNGLQLDSLYNIIIANTRQVYAGDITETNSYNMMFGELRGKYANVKSSDSTNPYVADYYIVCVSGRIYMISCSYLSTFSEAQLEQVKNFVNTIHFNEKLGYNDQMNRN